jgi:hypothetical protein
MGPQGPTGPIGKPGLQGPQGFRGVQGPDGPTGPIGKQGTNGQPGFRGVQGPDGITGLQGKTGAVGQQGFRGFQGPDGITGPIGRQGTNGQPGFRGFQGPDGATGLQGKEGIAGPQGDKGPDGPMGNPGPDGPIGIQGNKGPDGDKGPQGNKGPDGPAGPMGNPGPDGPSNFLFAPGTFVESAINERITLGVEPHTKETVRYNLLNRDTDFQYDASWTEYPPYASLQEIGEFSVVFKNTQGVCDLSTISWIGGTEEGVITVSITKMGSVAEEMFLTTDTQSENLDTTYGQITFKKIIPAYLLNADLGHSIYVLQFDAIPNICPFEVEVWYNITIKYDQPIRTLVYDYTHPLPTSVERANVDNSYVVRNSGKMARAFAEVAAPSTSVVKGQVVPLNIDAKTFDPTRPQMRASMTICKPNYYQFENLPSWEYCQRFDIKGVLCLYEGGFLRISGSRPSAFDEIVSKMKAPQGGGRFDAGLTGPNPPNNENPTPSEKPIWYPVYAETQQGYMNGSSVSINHDGTIIAIGSPNENCVRVYMQTNRGWIQRGNTIMLENQNDPSGDFFGTSIVLNGNGSQIAVGSPGNGQAGCVAIYEYAISDNYWVQYGLLPNENDGIVNTYTYGSSISMDNTGNRIIIGCPNAIKRIPTVGGGTDDQMMDTTSGCAYIYTYGGEPGYWILEMVIEDEFRWGRTGASVSMNDTGNLVAVGSPHAFDKNPDSEQGGSPGCGSVRIFAHNNEHWSQIGVVRGQNQFGQSVSIIGSPANHIIGATAQDRLCAYNNVDGTSDYSTMLDNWLSTSLKNTTVHISRSGDHMAFGYNDCVQKVLVYETATQTSFTITDIAPNELLSHMDVRINQQGNRIVIGAPLSSDFLNRGMVYVYENRNKPVGNIPELNGTEPFDRILELQNQAITASDTIITVGSVATIQIRSGMVETVEIFINENWVPLYMNNEVKGDMYYILSEYTDTGCMMSICNIPVPDIFVRINNELQITKVFRHYNLDGSQPTVQTKPVSDNWKKVSASVVRSTHVLKFQQVVRDAMKNKIIVSQPTDVPVPVVPVPAPDHVSDNTIVFESYINNKYGPSVYIPIRSGIVEHVAILVANEWIHIYTDAETSGMYYNVSDYTDTGCLLTINNIPVDDIQVLVNNRFMASRFNIYGPTPAPAPPTEYQLRVLELQAQKNVSAGDINYDGSTVSVQIRSGMVSTVEIAISQDEIQSNGWRQLYTKTEIKSDMYYRLGDYTDTGCVLFIYNISASELHFRINGNLHLNTIYGSNIRMDT